MLWSLELDMEGAWPLAGWQEANKQFASWNGERRDGLESSLRRSRTQQRSFVSVASFRQETGEASQERSLAAETPQGSIISLLARDKTCTWATDWVELVC